MPLRRVTVVYSGRVQGVGFRATARSVAGTFDLSGWVRNEPDGSVRLEVQGDEAEIARYLEVLADRMRGNIRSVSTLDASLETSEAGFQVRR